MRVLRTEKHLTTSPLVIRDKHIVTTLRFHLISVRMAKINKTNDSWRGSGVKRTLIHYWQGANMYSHYAHQCAVSQEAGNRSTSRSSYTTLFCIYTILAYQDSTPNYINVDICSSIIIAALFTIARNWKQSRCSSVDDRIMKMWYICTMDYSLIVKKNKI